MLSKAKYPPRPAPLTKRHTRENRGVDKTGMARNVAPMQHTFSITTNSPGLYEFTDEVARFVSSAKIQTGLLTLFVQHTSCSLLISENADPDVMLDMNEFFARLVPENMDWLRHTCEGPDDMPAHIKAALTPCLPVHPHHQCPPGSGYMAGHLSVRAPPRAS